MSIRSNPSQSHPRWSFALIGLLCAGLLGYALWVQHVRFLDPCPLCVLQRLAFMALGVIALAAALHGPGKAGRRVYGSLAALAGLAGAAIATRHVWLQNLPPERVPECGPGLDYMLDTMPFAEVMGQVLRGSGSCAEIDWQFLGLSMPAWTLAWFVGLTALALWAGWRREV